MTITQHVNTFQKYTIAATIGFSAGFVSGALARTQSNKKSMRLIATMITQLMVVYLIALPEKEDATMKDLIIPLSKKDLLAIFTAAIGWYCGFSKVSLFQRKLRAIQ